MGTGNFAYKHRCIVVTDNDYEADDYPKLGGIVNNNLDFPSYEIIDEDTPEFDFWKPVLTQGYYADGCIDYVRTECTAEYWLGAEHYYETKKEVIDECIKQFGLSRYRLNKILPKWDKSVDMFYEWYDEAINALTKYLAKIEENKINEYLDRLKEEYGYEEIARIATASNGEAFYQRVS